MLSTEKWMRDVATRRTKRDEKRKQLVNEYIKQKRYLAYIERCKHYLEC